MTPPAKQIRLNAGSTLTAAELRAIDALGVRRLTVDSRAVKRGDTFVAYPGESRDGREFIAQAVAAGASSILWERRGFKWNAAWRLPNLALPQLRARAGLVASHVHAHPGRRLRMIGITGTNGKTTCSQWIARALNQRGIRTAVIGTLGYGLRGTLCDDRHAARGLNAMRPRTAAIDRRASRMDRLPVITTGLIGWNRSHWGERPARLLGRAFLHPAVRVPAVLPRPELRGWLSDALYPKILVATQTPVIEAVVDPFGELAPGVPVIRLLPHDAHDVWLLAAALLAPATSAIAWWRHAGAGLSPRAIKLSAKQLAALPLPVNASAWRTAATRLREAREARGGSERAQALERFMHAANSAYAVPKSARMSLARWWQPRAWGTFSE